MNINKIFLSLGALFLIGCGGREPYSARALEEFCTMFDKKITSAHDIDKFFPKTVEQVHEYAAMAMARAQKSLDKIIELESPHRTFDNTAGRFDQMAGQFSIIAQAISALELVSPDGAMRDACHQASLDLYAYAIDAFSNKKIYQAFKEYVDSNSKHETLRDDQRYFLEETMRDFKRQGLNLPDAAFEAVKSLKKELSKITMAFDTNINNDASKVIVTHGGLAGLDEHFIKALKRDDQGNYLLGCDTPTYIEVLEHCTVEETRRKLYFAYMNRAYPVNHKLLEEIIEKRDRLAKMLGFASYAALDIDNEMAKKPDVAEKFIRDLAVRASKKAHQEFEAFTKELPEGVTLDEKGRMKGWDNYFIRAAYKKKHYDIDDRLVAEYFEVEKTLKGVFDIYQRFLSLEFTLVKPTWAWHEDVKLIEVHDRETKALRGYILLDLYPRENKYSHACCAGLVAAYRYTDEQNVEQKAPYLGLVIANFPQATADRPALIKHSDVETFFHEFGHAMHGLLGCTRLLSFAGTAVKTDFVEMPSQIFEEWMFDRDLLKGLTSHYKTGQPLPDILIDKIIALKKFDSGNFVVRQSWLSLISLEFFKDGAHKNTDAIVQNLSETLSPYLRYEPETHFYVSWGHLTGYGAKYYGYQWAKVFALDIFYKVREEGLVNPAAGKVFTDKILAKGGSVDPNILIRDYLGREPRLDAYLADSGID